eukprot:scaffold1815_cov17-Tisochrysis_lutea.AAC.1
MPPLHELLSSQDSSLRCQADAVLCSGSRLHLGLSQACLRPVSEQPPCCGGDQIIEAAAQALLPMHSLCCLQGPHKSSEQQKRAIHEEAVGM